MNMWQYFDNRSKRNFAMKQLKYYRKEREAYSLMWDNLSTRLYEAHLSIVNALDAKIKYYENLLNSYL